MPVTSVVHDGLMSRTTTGVRLREPVSVMLDDRYVDTLFLNETGSIHGLCQFDAPSSPEKWERIWSEVEAA